jgi:hypothetical protein
MGLYCANPTNTQQLLARNGSGEPGAWGPDAFPDTLAVRMIMLLVWQVELIRLIHLMRFPTRSQRISRSQASGRMDVRSYEK